MTVAAVAWGIALALLCPGSDAAAQPKLAVEGPVFDFGQVEQGMTVDHIFRLVNQGTETLVLDQVKSSCGCTAAVTSATEIPPGQAGTVSVTLDTLKLAGATTKTITVYSNDPAVPAAGVTLTGRVVADVYVSPATLYVGRLRKGAAGHFEIAVAAGRPNMPVTIVDVRPDNALLTARIDAAPDGGQRVVVETSPDLPLGKFNAEVTITTTSVRNPKLVVPVFGTVEGDEPVQSDATGQPVRKRG